MEEKNKSFLLQNYMVSPTIFCTITLFSVSANAQEKVAYLDLYQRGGGQNLKTTITYGKKTKHLGRSSLGEALNKLAEQGWAFKESVSVKGTLAIFTRHKFHVILEKRYNEGENPFKGLDKKSDAIVENKDAIVENKLDDKSENSIVHTIEQKGVNMLKEMTLMQPNNIYYTSLKKGAVDVEFGKSTDFISNTYVDGKGILEFHTPVTVIPRDAFSYVRINRIAIPESVESIKTGAFDSNSIEQVWLQSTNPAELGENVFSHTVKIYVPESSVMAYKSAWDKYADQIIGYDVTE